MQKIYKGIDLFAGIGGIRLGFQQAFKDTIEFVFSCEIDEYCRKTYHANFGVWPEIDIRDFPIREIPDFDILMAGFPCQAFSKVGYREGFNDERGNLFFYIRDIIKKKQPISFFLENVDNLIIHDKGRTFSIIKYILESELKYYIQYKILNAMDFGLPQRRKRIFIVGYKKNLRFEFPEGDGGNPVVGDILETKLIEEKYYLSQQLFNTLKNHRERHKLKGHGFGYKVIGRKEAANTIVCGGMGAERNLLLDKIYYTPWKPGDDPFKKKNKEGLRKMTEREWARLQGFPDSFVFPVSMTQAYKQLANSVPVPVIKAIASKMKNTLEDYKILKSKRKLQKNLSHYLI